MVKSELVLFVPAFNPGENWHYLFKEKFLEFANTISDMKPTVVLINDGSSNDLSQGVGYLQRELKDSFVYLSYPNNRGKGGALKYGASQIEGQKYMFTDIDFPYEIESMVRVWKTIQSNSGIVTGFREENYYADVSLFRTILSKSLRWLNHFLLGLPINDTQCGLKAFDNEVKNELEKCQTDRFLIDLELLMAINKKGLNITPVKVNLRNDIDFTKFNSTVLLKEVFNFCKLIVKYRF